MTILTEKQIADWRAANWFADNDDCADGFRALCDTAELGLRAIEVLRRLDEIEDGFPITDRFGDGGAYASEKLEAILNGAAAIVAEAQTTK